MHKIGRRRAAVSVAVFSRFAIYANVVGPTQPSAHFRRLTLVKVLVFLYGVAIAALLANCGQVAYGHITTQCDVRVLDQSGRPVSGATVLWVDRGDDRIWRNRAEYEICITDRIGACSGKVAYHFCQYQDDVLHNLHTSNYEIAAVIAKKTVAERILTPLSSAQLSGSEAIAVTLHAR